MEIFDEKEIEKSSYINFMTPDRIGYEIQFNSIIQMLSDSITLSRLQEGEWLCIDGVVKDDIAKITFFIMSKLGYIENQAPVPDHVNKLVSSSKIITLSIVKMIVFGIIALSPLIHNRYVDIIDKNVLHMLVIDLERLHSLNNRAEFKFICNMYIKAVKMLLENVDEYNKKLINTEALC